MPKRDPVEIAHVHIAVLVEGVCVALIFGAFMALLIIAATPVPV